MTNAISKMFAVLIALALLYIYPAAEAAKRQDELAQLVVYNAVTQFVDAVRMKGYITPVMYQDLLDEMNVTGNSYEVILEHQHKKYHPNYLDAANPGTFQDSFDVYFLGTHHEMIMAKLFPDNSLPKDSLDRRYQMMVGDFVKVKVKSTNRTAALVLSDFVNGSNSADRVAVAFSYGGMVINEDY